MESNRRLQALVTVLVFVATIYRYRPLASPLGPCGSGYESLELACSLAKRGAFSDPYWTLSTGASAHLAPLFPWLISLPIRCFGDTAMAMDAVQWMGTVALAIQIGLWPWVAQRLGMRFSTGVLAAAAWLWVGFSFLPMWEAPYLALLILALVLCMDRILGGQGSGGLVVSTAVLWGVVFLLSPVPLLVYLALMGWILILRRVPRAQMLALLLIPVLIVAPWVVRNYLAFHHFVFIRDNLGLELANSNSPCATYSFQVNVGKHCYPHPNDDRVEAMRVQAMGEYAYNQQKMAQALNWIRSNPAKFATLTRQRFLAFWFFTPVPSIQHAPVKVVAVGVLTLLGAGGLFLLWRRQPASAVLCLVWVLFYPPVYYLVAFTPRYRDPILWTSFLPAAYLAAELPRRRSTVPKTANCRKHN